MIHFPKKQEHFTIKEILSLINCTLKNESEEILSTKIYNIATLGKAQSGDVSFYSNPSYIHQLKETKASACFIKEASLEKLPQNTIALISADPYLAFSNFLRALYGEDELMFYKQQGIHSSAHIHPSAVVGNNVRIFPNVVISEDAKLEDGVTILPNTFIGSKVKIGKNSIIHDNCSIMFADIGEGCIIRSGVRIGASGFGFAPNLKTGKHAYIPQICGVKIGNFVDVGANTTIDRGALEETEIGDNVKLDNLIQIGHGVKIGRSTFVAAQTGIAGSADVGNFCFIGPQAGIVGHIKVADFTQVVAGSGVMKAVPIAGQVLAGWPAVLKGKWDRMQVKLQQSIFNKK
jgi:UDP-3-O-[3-hydroxymyristoyl] glucosamine N-acyltransferase